MNVQCLLLCMSQASTPKLLQSDQPWGWVFHQCVDLKHYIGLVVSKGCKIKHHPLEACRRWVLSFSPFVFVSYWCFWSLSALLEPGVLQQGGRINSSHTPNQEDPILALWSSLVLWQQSLVLFRLNMEPWEMLNSVVTIAKEISCGIHMQTRICLNLWQ